VKNIDRRDFLKKSGTGLMIASASTLWYDLLFSGKLPTSSSLFEERFGISKEDMKKILSIALSKGGQFSELFFEYRINNVILMEEEIIKETGEHITLGVGIRVLKNEQTGYGYTNELSFNKMKETALTAAAIASGGKTIHPADLTVKKVSHQYYDMNQSLHSMELDQKIDLVKAAHAGAKEYDSRISKVFARLADEIQYVTIMNSEGLFVSDIRPQNRIMVKSTAEQNGRRNTSTYGVCGGRVGLAYYQNIKTPKQIGQESAEEAITLLSADDAPAGEQTVVLGSEGSGVLVHEAIGHPLEADANWKKTSIMSDKMGQMVANPIVTIVDDATIPHYRGTLNIDDEGTETQPVTLIEKGKLVNYMHDILSSRLMHTQSNGHGRRASYRYNPIPRMNNTLLIKGNSTPEEVIQSVKKGFYAKTFTGGMVSDSGKFTFSVNTGFLIENGKLTRPLKNATLVGTNVQILNDVDMIADDMGFFLGTCGKDGQGVAALCGTPTLRIQKMTVGGRA
jgi:TldD protein